MRLLLLFLAALLLGSGACELVPAWQQRLLVPGDVRTLTAGADGLDLTIEDKSSPEQFFIIQPEEAQRLFAAGAFSTSAGLAVREASATGHGGKVTWTTSSRHQTITHHAPGLHLDLRATVEAIAATPPSPTGDVTWTSPLLQDLAKKGSVVVRNGWAKWETDHFLLTRAPLFPDAAARKQAVLTASIQAGFPFTMVAFVTLVSVVLLRSPAGETEAVTSEEGVRFPRSLYGARLNSSVWAGMTALVPAIVAGVTLFDRNVVDLPEAIDLCFGLGLLEIPLLILIGWLTVRPLREVEANPDGLIVRAGPFRKLALQASWSELQPAVAGVRYYKGRISDEWVELRTVSGQKIRIGRNHVREFPKVRAFLIKRTSPPAAA